MTSKDAIFFHEVGLLSSNFLFKNFNLVIFFIQFVFVMYFPWFYKILTLSLIPFIPSQTSKINNIILSNVASNKIQPTFDKVELIVLNQYRSFIDDKKARIGHVTDLAKLRTFGFKNNRFLSNDFYSMVYELSMRGGVGEKQVKTYNHISPNIKKKNTIKKR